MTMTAMTGIWCLIASRLKLGMLADFLSRPILMGLLNGVAITIMVGQLSRSSASLLMRDTSLSASSVVWIMSPKFIYQL